MGKIHLLPEELINKIAAGEVVDRPASIVKELLENAIDAKATSINIIIKNAGKDLIQITDNGCGMSHVDARTSLLRHATSKISEFTDLYKLHTLGFRGEALASIAAVSKLILTTKNSDESKAIKIESTAGLITKETTAPHNIGTTIEVHNVFFNTPARKKFLKTDAVEMSHIIDTVTNYCLLHPEISFKLTHDNHDTLNAPQTENITSRIAQVYTSELAQNLIEIHNVTKTWKIRGLISTPYHCRNDKGMQTIFLNNRIIKNQDITKAIYEGYHARLFVGKHPIFTCIIEADPLSIDVNVHPQKTEVKIENQQELLELITKTVSTALEQNDIIPEIEVNTKTPQTKTATTKYKFALSTQQILPSNNTTQEPINEYSSPPFPTKSSAESHATYPSTNISQIEQTNIIDTPTQTQTPAPTKIATSQNISQKNPQQTSQNGSQESSQDIPQKTSQNIPQEKNNIPPFKILGQIHKTFWLAETQGGMFILDQHAVHERVMYDKFITEKQHKNIKTQALIIPVNISVTPAQNSLLQEQKNNISSMGFDLDQIGPTTYTIRSIPFVFERAQPKELILELLESLSQTTQNKISQTEEEIITRMACRAAIKAGDNVTQIQFEKIVSELKQCDFPFTCPHGRPSIIKITADELEKKFRRKG